MKTSIALIAVLLSLAYLPAHAQSTAFTYQGSLEDAGVRANGLHDFRVLLYNMASGGVVVGPPQCIDNVNVIDGVFTLQLDFGQVFATATERHLEIAVRQDAGLTCGDLTGFVALTPRQQIAAAPMAGHANSAFSLDAADGSPASAVFVDDSGNVGIGTTTPTARLDVRGGAMLVENLGDQADLLWLASERSWVFRQEGTGAGTALKLESIGGGGNKNFIVKTDGFMGVGTTSPTAKLDVRGDVKLGPAGQYFAASAEENLRTIRGTVNYDGTIGYGTGWTVARTAAGSYTIFFNTLFSGRPSVVASAGLATRTAAVSTPSEANFAVRLYNTAGVLTDNNFYFIATGPR
jgi:hypothetical protein